MQTKFPLPLLLATSIATLASPAMAADQTVQAVLDFVADECAGDWTRITSKPSKVDFSSEVLKGYAGTFSAKPVVDLIDPIYQQYSGRWFRAQRRSGDTRYKVDVFTRIQRSDAQLDHQNFLRVSGNGDDNLSWQNHFYFPQTAKHPVWTGETLDVEDPFNRTGDLHAHWHCDMRYPEDGRLRFSAMHELYMAAPDGSAPFRVQIEVRQSANQGTTAAVSKGSFTCPTYGTRWMVNGFGHPAYKVWTLTLEKNYDPSSPYKGNVNLSGMVRFLKQNPNIWPGGTFPATHEIRRVETGLEYWTGGQGSRFTSHSCLFRWK